jgi:hypothetical protein
MKSKTANLPISRYEYEKAIKERDAEIERLRGADKAWQASQDRLMGICKLLGVDYTLEELSIEEAVTTLKANLRRAIEIAEDCCKFCTAFSLSSQNELKKMKEGEVIMTPDTPYQKLIEQKTRGQAQKVLEEGQSDADFLQNLHGLCVLNKLAEKVGKK